MILIHAQGVDAVSFENVWGRLSKKYHIFSIDCYGHGESLHNVKQYNLEDISKAVICFIEDVVQEKVFLLGHSSGGLIAAYIASRTESGSFNRCLAHRIYNEKIPKIKQYHSCPKFRQEVQQRIVHRRRQGCIHPEVQQWKTEDQNQASHKDSHRQTDFNLLYHKCSDLSAAMTNPAKKLIMFGVLLKFYDLLQRQYGEI